MVAAFASKTTRLDVRAILEAGAEPFDQIMAVVASLDDDEDLLLVAPFEPVPLEALLSGQGFQHQTHRIADDHWEVRFSRV